LIARLHPDVSICESLAWIIDNIARKCQADVGVKSFDQLVEEFHPAVF